MNELQVFESDEFERIKDLKANDAWHGFVYFFEYGNYIKIGSTKNPYERIASLKNQARYHDFSTGRVAITVSHINYVENEKKLHEAFKKFRKNHLELFFLDFDKAIKEYQNYISFEFEKDIDNKDEEFLNYLKNNLFSSRKFFNNEYLEESFLSLIYLSPSLVRGNADEEEIKDELIAIADENDCFENIVFMMGVHCFAPLIKGCRLKSDKVGDYQD